MSQLAQPNKTPAHRQESCAMLRAEFDATYQCTNKNTVTLYTRSSTVFGGPPPKISYLKLRRANWRYKINKLMLFRWCFTETTTDGSQTPARCDLVVWRKISDSLVPHDARLRWCIFNRATNGSKYALVETSASPPHDTVDVQPAVSSWPSDSTQHGHQRILRLQCLKTVRRRWSVPVRLCDQPQV